MKYFLVLLDSSNPILEFDGGYEMVEALKEHLQKGERVAVFAGLVGRFTEGCSILNVGSRTFRLVEPDTSDEVLVANQDRGSENA